MDTTFGVEEELLVVDMTTGDASPHNFDLTFKSHPEYKAFLTPEFHMGTIEVKTGVHSDYEALCREVSMNRRFAVQVAAEQGQLVLGSGSHPVADWRTHATNTRPQSLEHLERHQDAARGAMTCGMHIHVGVPELERIKLFLGLREYLPLFLAVSANSPFFEGRDTGLSCWRLSQLDRYPRMGVPDPWDDLKKYRAAVEKLEEKGLIRIGTMMWHDLRIHRWYDTVEIRIFDVQMEARDASALIALVMLATRAVLASPGIVPTESWKILENRWLAMRHGVEARLVDWRTDEMLAVDVAVQRMAEAALQNTAVTQVEEWVAAVNGLLSRNGAKRQRDYIAAGGDVKRLPLWMAVSVMGGVGDGC